MFKIWFSACCTLFAVFALLGCLEAPKKEAVTLNDTKDLRFKRICVIQGGVDDQYVSIKYPRATKVRYEQIEDIFNALETDSCDGSLILSNYANNNQLNSHKQLGVLQNNVFAMDVAFAFQKNEPRLLEQFNNYLIKLKVSGELEQITNGWERDPDEMKLPKNGNDSNGFLRIATSLKHKPSAFLRDNQPAGYNIDILFRFAEKMGLKASIVEINPDSNPVSMLAANKADLIADNIGITESLAKDVIFSIPHKIETATAIAKMNNIKESRIHNITLLHTGGSAMFSQNGYGGLAERATFLKHMRENYRNSILLDAGNLNIGNFISKYHNAMPHIKAYNIMNYDAVAFGNHDFDNPIYMLREQIDSSEFKWLGVNVRDNTGKGDYVGAPYLIKNIDGIKVGIVGVSSIGIKNMSMYAKQVQWINEIASVRRIVKMLKNLSENESVDIIILLANFGDASMNENYITAEILADSIPDVNLIVQSGIPGQASGVLKIRNNIPIVSAGTNGRNVGLAQMSIRNNSVISFTWNTMPIESNIYEPDIEISKMLEHYANKVPEDFNSIVMKTTAKFEQFNQFNQRLSYRQETSLGNLISDAMVWLGKNQGKQVDFAIISGNVIHAGLPEGDVTKGDLVEALPYDNVLKIVSMHGTNVAKLFKHVESIPLGDFNFPQVSKEARYKITYTSKNGQITGKISDISINESSIDSSKIYNIVTTDFLLEGSDNYAVFKNNSGVHNTSMPIRSVVIKYLETLKMPITPTTDERIKVIELHSLEGS